MGNTSCTNQSNFFWCRINGTAERSTKRPCSVQGRKRRALAVDVHRNNVHVVIWCQKVERHHNAMVEFPFLGIRHVHVLHDVFDETVGQIRIAGNGAPFDAQPLFVLDRALVVVGHPDAICRHIIHKEICKCSAATTTRVSASDSLMASRIRSKLA